MNQFTSVYFRLKGNLDERIYMFIKFNEDENGQRVIIEELLHVSVLNICLFSNTE